MTKYYEFSVDQKMPFILDCFILILCLLLFIAGGKERIGITISGGVNKNIWILGGD